MSPLAIAVRNTMQPTEFKGGGLKKVVAVVAMVAIPFVAPALSTSIGLSASIGATAGSAVVGAGLGAVTSAVTGGDWKKGALMGGIAGGIAGYNQPTFVEANNLSGPGITTPASDPMLAPQPQTAIGPTMADGTYGGLSAAQEAQVGMDSLAYDDYLYDQTLSQQQTFATGPTTESAYATDLGASDPGNMYDQTYADSSSPATSSTATAYDTPVRTGYGNNTAGATQQTAGVSTGGATPKTGWEGFKEGIAEAYSPQNLGKQSMQMAGNALVNAVTGEAGQYTPEQQELIDSRKAEVARLEAQGAEVDKIKLAEARKLLQQALQVDPTYLARQKANAAKNQASRATNEAVRRAGATGNRAGLSASIKRRGELAGGKHAASAYDVGYQGGLKEKLALQESGVSMLPDSSSKLSGYYTGLGAQYTSGQEARDKEREAYNKLFGNATLS